jgi:hypothetical protein
VVNRYRFFFNAIQNLQFVRLIQHLDPLLSLFPRHHLPHQWEIPSNDPILPTYHSDHNNHCSKFKSLMQAGSQGVQQTHHLLFDLLQVLIRQGLHVKVIIEAIVYPGAYSHLGIGEQLLDSHGHHMGALQQQLYGAKSAKPNGSPQKWNGTVLIRAKTEIKQN